MIHNLLVVVALQLFRSHSLHWHSCSLFCRRRSNTHPPLACKTLQSKSRKNSTENSSNLSNKAPAIIWNLIFEDYVKSHLVRTGWCYCGWFAITPSIDIFAIFFANTLTATVHDLSVRPSDASLKSEFNPQTTWNCKFFTFVHSSLQLQRSLW